MTDAHSLFAFVVASTLLIIVPGPSVLFVISRGVALGRRAALLTVAGNSAGAFAQVIVVAAGLGALLERSAVLFDAIRLLGAAYLVYLGVQMVRHRREGSALPDVTLVRSSRHIVREGFVVGVTNPKLMVFLSAVLPQFVAPGSAPVPLQLLALGAVFVAIAMVLDGCWGFAAGTARTWLSAKPQRLERLGGAGGLVVMGLGVRVAMTGRHD
ncbi:MAG TPA: LysE family translocator [Acidimicrobiales bacterium]